MPKGPKGTRIFTRGDREAYAMIAPFFLFFIVFVLIPIGVNIVNSFTNYNLDTKKWVGLRNYARLFQDAYFLRSLRNTAVYAIFSVIPLVIIGFVAAMVVKRQTRAMFAARALLMFPYVSSMVAVSMVWLYLLEPTNGILNKLLGAMGIPGKKWLFDENLALPCLTVVNIWKNIGYVMIIFLAGLAAIPKELYEAGRVDGAGDFRMLFSITIPCVRPVTVFVVTTMCIEAFKTFDQVNIMTNGGPLNSTTTVVHQIYVRAFTEFQMGYASAMSVMLLILVFLITCVNLRMGSGGEVE